MGIATALNQGFRYFLSSAKRYDWILSLDQDSICKSSLISDLVLSYKECPFRSEVGIIGSNYIEKSTQKILHATHENSGNWEEVKNLPTSGSLTSLAAYGDVGGFRDDFFIDYVDTDYCMRMREKGYRILISKNVGMIHPLGYYRNSRLHHWLKGNSLVTSYPAVRHYYWTRNGSILIWEHLTRDFGWSLSQIYYIFFRRIVTVILFEDKKLLKLYNIATGILHAWTGVRGVKIQ
jgi:rhamnosyltransferase